MERITRDMLEKKLAFVQKLGAKIEIDWLGTRPRLRAKTGGAKISPQATKSLLWDFLDVFEEGFSQGRYSRKEDGK